MLDVVLYDYMAVTWPQAYILICHVIWCACLFVYVNAPLTQSMNYAIFRV